MHPIMISRVSLMKAQRLVLYLLVGLAGNAEANLIGYSHLDDGTQPYLTDFDFGGTTPGGYWSWDNLSMSYAATTGLFTALVSNGADGLSSGEHIPSVLSATAVIRDQEDALGGTLTWLSTGPGVGVYAGIPAGTTLLLATVIDAWYVSREEYPGRYGRAIELIFETIFSDPHLEIGRYTGLVLYPTYDPYFADPSSTNIWDSSFTSGNYTSSHLQRLVRRVPEPTALSLLFFGLAGLAFTRRRR